MYLTVSMAEAYFSCLNAINCTGKNMSQSLMQSLAVTLSEANKSKYMCSKDQRPGKNFSCD